MPKTTKKEYQLPTGETLEEVYNIFQKCFSSIIELDENSKLIAPNIKFSPNNAFDYVTLNTEVADAPTTVGTFYWDAKDNVPTVVLPDGVNLQVGKEQFIDGLNKTGTTISNGEVVFASGAQGNRLTVDPYDADDYGNGHKTIGMATQDVLNNLNGNITTFGLVRDLDTSAYTEGQEVFASTTAGAITTVTPAFGTGRWHVGIVVKSHVTQGEIFLNIHEDKYMFGDVDGGNYSGFEEDGTLVAIGDAITWRDEYVASEYFVPSGASAPDVVNITVGGVTTKKYAFDGKTTSEKLGSNHEIQHDIAVEWVNNGTLSIEQHIHCCATTTASGTATFVTNWCLLKANGGASGIITGSNITASIYFDGSQTPYCNALLGDDLVTPAEGFGIGDLIEFTITRDPALASDTYEDDVVFYKSALHVPVDTFGSRQRYVK